LSGGNGQWLNGSLVVGGSSNLLGGTLTEATMALQNNPLMPHVYAVARDILPEITMLV